MNRLKQLAGIKESFDDSEDDHNNDIENAIYNICNFAFNKIDIQIYEQHGIMVDIHNDQAEIIINLSDDTIDIKKLNELYKTGLSKNYEVTFSNSSLQIKFILSPNLLQSIKD